MTQIDFFKNKYQYDVGFFSQMAGSVYDFTVQMAGSVYDFTVQMAGNVCEAPHGYLSRLLFGSSITWSIFSQMLTTDTLQLTRQRDMGCLLWV